MIILIGNRFGFLIPLLVLFAELGVQAAADAYFGPRYFERHLWTWSVGLFVSAVVCWLLGRMLRGRQPPSETGLTVGNEPAASTAAYARYTMREIDKEEGFNSPRDSFFFLHMIYWAPILTVIGFIILLVGWLR